MNNMNITLHEVSYSPATYEVNVRMNLEENLSPGNVYVASKNEIIRKFNNIVHVMNKKY
jgi:predicted nucleotidyltransferase